EGSDLVGFLEGYPVSVSGVVSEGRVAVGIDGGKDRCGVVAGREGPGDRDEVPSGTEGEASIGRWGRIVSAEGDQDVIPAVRNSSSSAVPLDNPEKNRVLPICNVRHF